MLCFLPFIKCYAKVTWLVFEFLHHSTRAICIRGLETAWLGGAMTLPFHALADTNPSHGARCFHKCSAECSCFWCCIIYYIIICTLIYIFCQVTVSDGKDQAVPSAQMRSTTRGNSLHCFTLVSLRYSSGPQLQAWMVMSSIDGWCSSWMKTNYRLTHVGLRQFKTHRCNIL